MWKRNLSKAKQGSQSSSWWVPPNASPDDGAVSFVLRLGKKLSDDMPRLLENTGDHCLRHLCAPNLPGNYGRWSQISFTCPTPVLLVRGREEPESMALIRWRPSSVPLEGQSDYPVWHYETAFAFGCRSWKLSPPWVVVMLMHRWFQLPRLYLIMWKHPRYDNTLSCKIYEIE